MGEPIRRYELPKKFDSGISISNPMPWAVPEFECREAAVFVQVSWSEWTTAMDGWARACAVAHYRSSLLVKAHVEDAADKAARRQRNRAGRRGGRGRSPAAE